MKSLFSGSFLSFSFWLALWLSVCLPCSARAESVRLDGVMTAWTSRLCGEDRGLCEPPVAIAPPQKITFEFEKPIGLGRRLVTDRRFEVRDLRVRVKQLWVATGSAADSYLMTQTELSDRNGELIAACSRYDALEAFAVIPPGACSGRSSGQVIGVSFSAPSRGGS